MEALSDLAAIAGDMPGYPGFVKKVATMQPGQNDPSGKLHILRDIKDRLSTVRAFERARDPIPSDFGWTYTRNEPNLPNDDLSGLIGRRLADEFDGTKYIEHKGRRAGNKYSMGHADQLEFLTDVVYFLRHNEKFEWVIPPDPIVIEKTRQRMKKMIGAENGIMDARLHNWLEWLKKDNEIAYDAAVERLGRLMDDLENGIVRGGNYEI